MRLTEGFITQETDGEQIMVSAGAVNFEGIARSNRTAAFIVDCLKTDTTKERIIDAMAAKYDAPREVIARDVGAILEKLRSIGALEE
jgi:hypothetical protein